MRDTYTPPVKDTAKSTYTTRSNASKQPSYRSKSSGRNASPDDAPSSVPGNTTIVCRTSSYQCVVADKLQQYLVAYVNQALSLDPPLPSAGRPFYTTCSQPDIIWYVNQINFPLITVPLH